MVVNCGDQIESQAESPAAIPIAVRNNPEAFQRADHMLVQDAFTGNLAVESLVLFCQRMFFAPLFRVTALGMQFRNPEIPRVCCSRHGWMNPYARAAKQPEIMTATHIESSADNPARLLVHHHLRFYRMPLLFARIVPSLLFLGRSTGVSVASTRITPISRASRTNAFFPGRVKAPERISVSSTQRIVS